MNLTKDCGPCVVLTSYLTLDQKNHTKSTGEGPGEKFKCISLPLFSVVMAGLVGKAGVQTVLESFIQL